ncbi:MAG: PfkB family carbohydrate kinase [Clostridia bacterium]|nr:PfkB family carbohydrate kinase [Clostridia bacterium]
MGNLTEREKEILHLLKAEPMLTQEDLAARLGITRSSAAVHISNLVKKGFILGRGYVFNEKSGVVVIGETCVETTARLMGVPEALERKTSGKMEITIGGTGRNVAEGLARLKVATTLITAVGQDHSGEEAVVKTSRIGVKVNHILRSQDFGTAKALVITNSSGKIVLEVEDRGINRTITPQEIEARAHLLLASQIVVADNSIPGEAVRKAFLLAGQAGARRVLLCGRHKYDRDILELADVLILDKSQALAALNKEDGPETGAAPLCARLLELGPKMILLILNSRELHLAGQGEDLDLSLTPGDRINLWEVRDILTAGFIYGFIKGYSYRQALRFGLRVAQVGERNTGSPQVKTELIEEDLLNQC